MWKGREEIMKKSFKKELIMKMNEIFKWLINVIYVINCTLSVMYVINCILRVRDHSHITGKYEGSAHQIFNTNYRLTLKDLTV